MPRQMAAADRLMVSSREAHLAEDVLQALEGPTGFLSVGRENHEPEPLPRDIGMLLQRVLTAVASGSTVTVTATPEELTTSMAAAMLGVSRPTVMKMINDGVLPSHKVGSHTRLKTTDVVAVRKQRRDRERAAFRALLELEDDEV